MWEGLFRALGYKHNAWAMYGLAENRLTWNEAGIDVQCLQARMLGLSGGDERRAEESAGRPEDTE